MNNILEKINKSALKFLVPLSPEETYVTIVNEATKLVGAMYGSIVLEQDGKLVRVYSSSPLAYKTVNRKQGNTQKAFKEKKVIVTYITEVAKYHPELIGIGVKTTVFIPLSYRGKSIGVLTVNLEKEPKGLEEHLDVLKLFGSMASLAVRKAQLHAETKKALEIRDMFLSMAAHELRTPLTTITVYLQLLSKRVQKYNDASLSRWVEELSSEAYRLSSLINELLVVNRIKAGELHYIWKECSVREIIRRAMLNFTSRYPGRRVTIEDNLNGGQDIIVGDFDKLLQVFINLLDNAAKFSPNETDIDLKLDRQNSSFIVEVKDKGTGISKEELPKVFEGFYKGVANQHKEGMGIGLYLSKNIITMHRGIVTIKSKSAKGTTVRVKLPRSTL